MQRGCLGLCVAYGSPIIICGELAGTGFEQLLQVKVRRLILCTLVGRVGLISLSEHILRNLLLTHYYFNLINFSH